MKSQSLQRIGITFAAELNVEMKNLPPAIKMYLMYHRDIEIPKSRYYVYVHRNPLTDLIFYVGSAKGNALRAFEFKKHRNQKWKNEVLLFGGFVNIKIEIVKTFETAREAQIYEFQLMQELKSRGEAYCCSEYSFLSYGIRYDNKERI